MADNYWTHRYDRRRFLRAAAASGGAAGIASILAACSSSNGNRNTTAAGTASRPAAGAGGTTTAAAPSGTIVYAEESEPKVINPLLSLPTVENQLLFRGLTKFDAQNQPAPDLATRWDVSSDGLQYTLHLRPGVIWHDGQPFTADDVKYTLDAVRDEKTDGPNRPDFASIDQVTVADPQTAVITLNQTFAPLLDKLTIGVVPKHLLDGKDINTADFNQKPVGTGPYMFDTWQHGQSLSLKLTPSFYDKKPSIAQFVVKFIPDPNNRLLQLKNGEVNVSLIAPKDAAQFKDSDKIVAYPYQMAVYRSAMMNMSNPLFQDQRVRVAMNWAMNRDAIIGSVLAGFGPPASGPLAGTSFYDSSLPTFGYDVQKAQALFAQAGWIPGSDGVLQNNGKKFSFTLYAPATDATRLDMANVAVTGFKKAGIDAHVETRNWDYILSNWDNLDAFMVEWGRPFDPDDQLYKVFLSTQTAENGGENFGRYKDPIVDQALQLGRTSLDPAVRKQAYNQVQDELRKNPPYAFGAYRSDICAADKRIQGLKTRTLGDDGIVIFWNIEDWTITK